MSAAAKARIMTDALQPSGGFNGLARLAQYDTHLLKLTASNFSAKRATALDLQVVLHFKHDDRLAGHCGCKSYG